MPSVNTSIINYLTRQERISTINISGTYTSAQTNTVLYAGPSDSHSSLYITDIKFTTETKGNYQLVEGNTSRAVWPYTFLASNGGENANLMNPILLRTGTALVMTSTPNTSHSIVVSGYIGPGTDI